MAVPNAEGSPPSPEKIKYAYMFEADKSPTMQFDSLLRAIARFIVCRPNAVPVSALVMKSIKARSRLTSAS